MSIQIEKVGRRYYVTGNTYAIKDQLRSKGCKWDPDRKQWWTGKKDVADKIEGLQVQRSEKTGDDLEVIGRAEYKGRTYYVVWQGPTKLGHGWKLAFSDGSKVFWAKSENGEPRWAKRYAEAKTIGSLRQFAEAKKVERENEKKALEANKSFKASDAAKEQGREILDSNEMTFRASGEAPKVGQTFRHEKHGMLMVVESGPSSYYSADDCEDMLSIHGGEYLSPGRYAFYKAVKVSEIEAETKERQQRAAAQEELKANREELERIFREGTHTPCSRGSNGERKDIPKDLMVGDPIIWRDPKSGPLTGSTSLTTYPRTGLTIACQPNYDDATTLAWEVKS